MKGFMIMKNLQNCFVATLALIVLPSALSAKPMTEAAAFCPLEVLGEKAAIEFGAKFVETAGEMSDAQYEPLANAIEGCAKKHKWSDAEAGAVSTLSISAWPSRAFRSHHMKPCLMPKHLNRYKQL
jgi:hypothetical protein